MPAYRKKHIILSGEIIFIGLFGGIYDFSFALYGAVLFAGLWSAAKRRGTITIPRNVTSYSLGIICLSYILSVFAANDRGMAVIGILRALMLSGFWLWWSNAEASMKQLARDYIPDIAAVLTGVTIILYFHPGTKDFLFRAGRMGGVFQYSNTYALFLLISVVMLSYKEKRRRPDYIKAGILIAGIVFCGSRSVMVLTVITIIIRTSRMNSDRKKWLGLLGMTALAVVAVQMMVQLDVERLWQLTWNSSTLNGRFLYWRDALPVLIRNPLGLGYMGYYFLQPQFQTGNYVTRFVHNDILQLGLDAGIFPMIALTVMIAANIWNKNNTKQNKTILIILLLHSLFDFDLQFSVMFFLLLMCMSEGDQKNYVWRWKGIAGICGSFTLVCIYFSIALVLSHIGMEQAALYLYPSNTSVRESLMQKQEGGRDAEILIEDNGMLADAYEYAARSHLENAEYMQAYEDIQGMLKTAGYQIYYYNQAVYDLSICLDMAVRSKDDTGAQRILEGIRGIPRLLEELKAGTSGLAYRIHDRPVFELDEEIEEYIESLSGISLT